MVSDIPAGDEKMAILFYSVEAIGRGQERRGNESEGGVQKQKRARKKCWKES